MTKWLLTFLIIGLPTTSALADVELRYTPPDSDTPATRIAVHDGRVRLTGSGDENSAILYDSAKHRFLILDNAANTYKVVDRQVVTNLRNKIARLRRLANAVPESVREMIEEHAPSLGAMIEHPIPTVTVAVTGADSRVGNYRCRTVTIALDGGIGHGACLASARQLDMPRSDAQTLAAMMMDLRRLGGKNLTLKPKAKHLLLEQAPIPVKYADLRHGRTLILKHIGQKAISDDSMRVPDDYEQKSLLGALGGL